MVHQLILMSISTSKENEVWNKIGDKRCKIFVARVLQEFTLAIGLKLGIWSQQRYIEIAIQYFYISKCALYWIELCLINFCRWYYKAFDQYFTCLSICWRNQWCWGSELWINSRKRTLDQEKSSHVASYIYKSLKEEKIIIQHMDSAL